MARELTDLQKSFLDYLFSEESKGDPFTAKKLAGYSDTVKTSEVVSALKDEIIERAKQVLASTSPKAIEAMKDVMLNPMQGGAPNKIKAATEILNRGGVLTREGSGTEIKVPESGIVILPAKNLKVVFDDSQGTTD